jgi:hypothetical protein
MLRELGERCYCSCLRCLSLFTDVDVAGLMDASLNTSKLHFQGDAQQWHSLVSQCVPAPICACACL